MNTSSLKEQQQRKIKTQPGFFAALDQSGGSTPKALRTYGIKEGAWSNDKEMFALVHQMRARVITSPSFNGDRIVGTILFEGTMDGDIGGQPTADYLWNLKRSVPFLKVDKGILEEKDGVQLLKPMPELAALLDKANANRIFGTKMRSFIKQANAAGVKAIVSQQFEVAARLARPDSSRSSSRKLIFTVRKRLRRKHCLKRASLRSSTNSRLVNWSCSRSRYRKKTTFTLIASNIRMF